MSTFKRTKDAPESNNNIPAPLSTPSQQRSFQRTALSGYCNIVRRGLYIENCECVDILISSIGIRLQEDND